MALSLKGCEIFVLPAGSVTKQRAALLKKQIEAFGGRFLAFPDSTATHILVDAKYDRVTALEILAKNHKMASLPCSAQLLALEWLSRSLATKQRCPEEDFQLPAAKTPEDPPQSAAPSPKKRKMEEAPEEAASSEEEQADAEPEIAGPPNLPRGTWVCATSSLAPKQTVQQNEQIINILTEMADTYKNINEKWRAYSYQKAVQALRKLDHPLNSREEAQALPGVGARLAAKIWEIAESGRLGKLDNLKDDGRVQALQTFGSIWGVGPTTAQIWVQAGHRSLQDIHHHVTNLTKQQEVGLRHYNDLLERMPRSEAGDIVEIVRAAVTEEIGEDFVVEGCGSFRRGKATCGDVDVLVTHPDGRSHTRVFPHLLRHLESTGFLTEHLVSVEENGDQKKYLGVCRLPGEAQKARRLDIIVVPYSEYACARLYFTGSAHFTRSMRHLAKRLNMSLNEHNLTTNVVRKDAVKVYKGVALPCPTEEAVFKHLGIPYREPHERDH